MDEILYTIEIIKTDLGFFGKLSNDNNEIKEFESDSIEELLKNIILDVQLDFDESYDHSKDFFRDAE